MRERRWESRTKLAFWEVLALAERLAGLGLKPATPKKEIICYIEEWPVGGPGEIKRLDRWPTEDVTMVHIREGWTGDFYLLAGAYHTVYQRYQDLGTYCSVSHPWRMPEDLLTHDPSAMFWLGFRDEVHGFIRVRLRTIEVITPGETREDHRRALWIEERRRVFLAAIRLLDLPIEIDVENSGLVLRALDQDAALFCSWPDAFGPCQFEYNSSDPFGFLVPASQLAATWGGEPATVRAYLTGFSRSALEDFQGMEKDGRSAYRCSAHCMLGELPDLLRAIAPSGRLYMTLCDFPTRHLRPEGEDAAAIIGVVGAEGGFKIEARLNRAPLPEEEMAGWLESLLGLPVAYSPLPPFP